jgi:hypothetical protein
MSRRRRKLLTMLAGFSVTALCLAPQLAYGRNIVIMILLILLTVGPIAYLFIMHYMPVRRNDSAVQSGKTGGSDGEP